MVFYDAVSQLGSLEELARSAEILELMEEIFKGSVQVSEQLVCRMMQEKKATLVLAQYWVAQICWGEKIKN